MSLFAPADYGKLIAPLSTFDAATYGGTAYARNVVISALALEITAQLVQPRPFAQPHITGPVSQPPRERRPHHGIDR